MYKIYLMNYSIHAIPKFVNTAIRNYDKKSSIYHVSGFGHEKG